MTIDPLIEMLCLSESLQENPMRTHALFFSCHPLLLSSLAQAFESILSSLHFDFIYPSEAFSIPLATHLSFLYKVPLFLSTSMDIFMHSGQTALLLDASSSFSLRLQSAVDLFKKREIQVSDALILLEPTEEEKKISQNIPLTLHYLWDIKEVQTSLKTIMHQNSYSKIQSSDIS